MESLNCLLEEMAALDKAEYRDSKTDLDPKLPEKYDDLHRLKNPYREAFFQIHDELLHAGASRVLYRSRLEGEGQILSFLHNGSQVPPSELDELNRDLSEIADRIKSWNKGFSGNRIAVQKLQGYGGRIHLENIQEDGYTVKTRVEIPV